MNWEALARHGMIAPEDLELFEFVDEPRAAFELLKRRVTLESSRPSAPCFAKSRCPPF